MKDGRRAIKAEVYEKLKRWLERQTGAQYVLVNEHLLKDFNPRQYLYVLKLVPSLDYDSIERINSNFYKKVERLGLGNSIILVIDNSEPPLGTQD